MPARGESTILVIDDDEIHLSLYTWILEGQGYKCKTALVGRTSLDLPEDGAIDLVLLDYRLNSSLTAVDVVLLVKRTLASVPIVILSEMQAMPEDMRDHVAGFVRKGDPKRLVDTIDGILDSSSAKA